jgi:hypothetical protein
MACTVEVVNDSDLETDELRRLVDYAAHFAELDQIRIHFTEQPLGPRGDANGVYHVKDRTISISTRSQRDRRPALGDAELAELRKSDSCPRSVQGEFVLLEDDKDDRDLGRRYFTQTQDLLYRIAHELFHQADHERQKLAAGELPRLSEKRANTFARSIVERWSWGQRLMGWAT